MKNFQIITIAVFIFFGMLGIVLFATQKSGKDKVMKISVWGAYDEVIFKKVAGEISMNSKSPFEIDYKQLREDEFDSVLIEALASGQGPDAIILPQDKIVKYENKIIILPFSSFSERKFKDDYVEAGEVYLKSDGIVGLPFSIDPLVLYWNRDILSGAEFTKPPAFWDELYSITRKITKIDNAKNILKSTIALGEYKNVKNAKEIISALIMQAGNRIVFREGENITVVLDKKNDKDISVAESVLRFYTEFSNSAKEMYSWNKSFVDSKREFLKGNVAFYIGFASEMKDLRKENPNLNFDIAKLPQARDSGLNKTFGRMNAIAVLKTSKNMENAFNVAFQMTGADAISLFSANANLPPISRDLLEKKQETAFMDIFYKSALISGAWLDLDPVATDNIFGEMVEDVTSGKLRISEAVKKASHGLYVLIKN